jgi:PEP-CTERM motif-containing protein
LRALTTQENTMTTEHDSGLTLPDILGAWSNRRRARIAARTLCACSLALTLVLDAPPASAQTEARVQVSNCGEFADAGAASAGQSVITTACGGAPAGFNLAEGAASFSTGSLFVNLVSTPGRGVVANASLEDQITFHVASGGSAVVPVNVSGSFRGRLFPSFSVSLGLGARFLRFSGSTTDSIDGNPGTDLYFPQTGDPLDHVEGAYSITVDWTIFDGATYGLLVGVQAGASDGATLYLDDPLTFRLPDGVTYTAASGSSYAAVSAVPEPDTFAAIAAGLALMSLIARRRQAARARATAA